MKAIITAALLHASVSWAQQVPPPVEGTNVLAVLMADSGAVAWMHVERVLEARGYVVQVRDAAALRLETKPYQASFDCLVTLQAKVMGHTILLSDYSQASPSSGYLHSPLSKYHRRSLSYSTQSHVAFGNFDDVAWGWNEVQAVAGKLAGKKMVYFYHPIVVERD